METATFVPSKKNTNKAVRAPTLRLVFRGGDARERVTQDDIGVTRGLHIGRRVEGENALAIPDDVTLSRHHASVEVDGDTVRIIDHSTNGTFVNGARVHRHELADGDVIRMGDTIFLLVGADNSGGAEPEIAGIIGNARATRKLRATLALMAPTDATILLLGETGTGKEVCARAVHSLSARPGPFIAVNCAAIPETLAEAQLFGHEAGAFTGARSAELGAFRHAAGGTLFLDEIGELSLPVQAKLLRALETREVTPVGTTASVPVDVRVVCATHVDLMKRLRAGAFRGDLYARVAELLIRLPPLRERREDVLPLLRSFLPAQAPPLGADLAERLLLHPWPFNVRELKKLAAELALHVQEEELDLPLVVDRLIETADFVSEDTPTRAAAPAPAPAPPAEREERVPPTREEVEALVREHHGNIARMGKAAGRSRRQIYRWLEMYGLDVDDYRVPDDRGGRGERA